jgi:hypothetical protein
MRKSGSATLSPMSLGSNCASGGFQFLGHLHKFTVAEHLVPLMAKSKLDIAFHGHTNASDPNSFAGPDSFLRVLAMSNYARINLDVGQFVAAGIAPLLFVLRR